MHLRLITLAVFSIFSQFSANSQQLQDFVVEKEYKMWEYDCNKYFLDTLGGGYITAVALDSSADILRYPWNSAVHLRLLDKTGKILKEKIVADSQLLELFDCTRVGDNFVLTSVHINIENPIGVFGKSFLYDRSLNLLQKSEYKFSSDLLFDVPEFKGQSIRIGDTTYVIKPIVMLDSSQQKLYFAFFTYDKNGYSGPIRIKYIDQYTTSYSLRNSFWISPYTFILPNFGQFNYFNRDLTLKKSKSQRNMRINLSNYYCPLNCLFLNGNIYIATMGLAGINASELQNFILKTDTSLNRSNSIQFNHSFIRDPDPMHSMQDIPPGCFYVDEAGNLNCLSYYNSVDQNYGLPSRIFTSKVSPDLDIIYQHTYTNPKLKFMITNGLYVGDGTLIVTGMVDSIESTQNTVRTYNPFIGLVKNGEISWATQLDELNTNKKVKFSGKITLLQNPVQDKLLLHYEGNNPSKLTITIYNMAGKVFFTGERWKESNQQINLTHLPTGGYIYNVRDQNGASSNGKFLKQ